MKYWIWWTKAKEPSQWKCFLSFSHHPTSIPLPYPMLLLVFWEILLECPVQPLIPLPNGLALDLYYFFQFWISWALNSPGTLKALKIKKKRKKKKWASIAVKLLGKPKGDKYQFWPSRIREDLSQVVIFELGLRISSIIIGVGGVYENSNTVIPAPEGKPCDCDMALRG